MKRPPPRPRRKPKLQPGSKPSVPARTWARAKTSRPTPFALDKLRGERNGTWGSVPRILPEPIDERGDPHVDRRGRLVAEVARDRVDVGIGARDVARLHRLKIQHRLLPARLLD